MILGYLLDKYFWHEGLDVICGLSAAYFLRAYCFGFKQYALIFLNIFLMVNSQSETVMVCL